VRTPDGGATWIDLEDACLGPRSWDLAVLARNCADDSILRAVTERVGEEALATAWALREIQAEVWIALHDARVRRGW
jgi:hypothetical protein